jgi:hypothetical protein
MSDFSITQEQINSLKDEVSIEERIENQLVRIRTKIGRVQKRTASQELVRVKKELLDQMEKLEIGSPYPQDFIDAFKSDLKKITREILQITHDYALFELIVKLENLTDALLYDVHRDRRRYPRFPLATDLFLTLEEETHTLLGIDISSLGIAFYATVELAVGRRYTILTRMPDGEPLTVDVLRATPSEYEQLSVWQTVCTFSNLVPWEKIREIISDTMGGVL